MQISAVNMPEWPINLQNVADIWPLIYVMAVFWVFDGKRETKDDLTVFLTNDFWLSIFIFSMLKGIYMGIRGIYNGRKLIFNCHLSMRLSKVCKVPLPLIEKNKEFINHIIWIHVIYLNDEAWNMICMRHPHVTWDPPFSISMVEWASETLSS